MGPYQSKIRDSQILDLVQMQGNPKGAQRIADFIAGEAEEGTAPHL